MTLKEFGMKKLNILFLVQLPPPTHGASMVNLSLINSKAINEEFTITKLPLNFVNKIDEIGKASTLKFWLLIKIVFKLFKQLLLKKVDLVYFTISPTGYAFYRDIIFVIVLKLFRKKIVYHLHGKGIKEKSEKSKLNKWLCIYVFKGSKVIILSNRLYQDIDSVYLDTPHVINNGIKQISINKTTTKRDNVVFVYLSNLVLSKGIKVLLDAIVITKEKGYNFKVKIIGDSADYTIEEAKLFVTENNLENQVFVIGPKYDGEKFEELSNSDVFVFPTQNDCFPLSILEAMQMQLAVISTSQGAIPDIIEHNENGVIVKENDVYDLSQAMIKYIEDKELITHHGTNNRNKFKQKYTQEVFEANFIKTINQILNETIQS